MTLARRLHRYVQGYGARAFDWASANCCHFGGGWANELRGADPMAGLPPTPTAAAARRLLRKLGGSLAAACTLQLEVEPFDPKLAKLGDLVALTIQGGASALGICIGRYAYCVHEGGVCQLPMRDATHAWRVLP